MTDEYDEDDPYERVFGFEKLGIPNWAREEVEAAAKELAEASAKKDADHRKKLGEADGRPKEESDYRTFRGPVWWKISKTRKADLRGPQKKAWKAEQPEDPVCNSPRLAMPPIMDVCIADIKRMPRRPHGIYYDPMGDIAVLAEAVHGLWEWARSQGVQLEAAVGKLEATQEAQEATQEALTIAQAKLESFVQRQSLSGKRLARNKWMRTQRVIHGKSDEATRMMLACESSGKRHFFSRVNN